MTKTNVLQISGVIFVMLAISVVTIWMNYGVEYASGATPGGLPADMATSGPLAVTNADVTIIGTSTAGCAARIISTNASAIKVTIGTLAVPSGSNGIWQAASTTAVYDGAVYGCGAVKVFSYTAQTIHASESK